MPEFVEQYRQRLGGAIDELAAVVARFDADSCAARPDAERRRSIACTPTPTSSCASAATRSPTTWHASPTCASRRRRFASEGAIARLATFATHYDSRIARGAYGDFEPAIPTSPEALALGLFGFVFGGGVVHVTGHQMRRRRLRNGPAQTVA